MSEVAEQDWHAPHRRLGATWVETGQQWAEVNFVPDWIAYSKKNPEYRFIAIREALSEQPLPGMEAQLELPFPVKQAGRRSLAQGLRVGDQPRPSGR